MCTGRRPSNKSRGVVDHRVAPTHGSQVPGEETRREPLVSLAALRKPMSDVYNKTRRTTYTNVIYETEQTRDARDATRRPAPAHAAARRARTPQRIRSTRVSTKTARCPGAPARPRARAGSPSLAEPDRNATPAWAARPSWRVVGWHPTGHRPPRAHTTCNGYKERGVLPECTRSRRPA